MKNAVLKINDRSSLEALQEQAGRSWGRKYRRVQVAFQALPDQENIRWQKTIEKWYHACGCGEGTIAGLAGLVAFGVSLFTQAGGIRAANLWDIPLAALAFFLASGLGKLAGLARARLNLSRNLAEFEEVLVQREIIKPKPEIPPGEEPSEPLCAVN